MEYFFNFDKLSYLQERHPDGCILCLVRDGSDDVKRLIVHESHDCIVSINLYPYNPGHLIIFPKRHVLDVRDLSPLERANMDDVLRDCLDVLDSTHKPSGYNIGYNMGRTAGASIDHLHMHVIPRFPREIGIAELIAGKRVLVEDPLVTHERVTEAFDGIHAPGKNSKRG